jgi:hypothetical protein
MELGTLEEVELIVDQIASNKIPPPNKAQSLVIIRQMMRMAKQVEAQAKEIAELQLGAESQAFELLSQQEKLCSYILELGRTRALCDQLGHALEVSAPLYREHDVDWHEALTAWRESK